MTYTFRYEGRTRTVEADSKIAAMSHANTLVRRDGIDYPFAWFDSPTDPTTFTLGHYAHWD